MSQIYRILSSHNLVRHDGRPLWKYNLSDTEFLRLKLALTESRALGDIDARDCALYYAEWWKRCYNGGIPSKRDVFNSIFNRQWYSEESFYQHAKRGANLLGIRWIKNQNTLFFRTLLLQGGIPVKHITNHKGAYKNFLLKILELNPVSVDDFAFDTSLTSLLPASSRNDEVYESCLEIVKAIINEDSDYLSILDTHHELNDITSELRIKRQKLVFERKKTKFKTTWVLETEKEHIRLYIGIPDMCAEDFKSLFLGSTPTVALEYEYKLFYNDLLLCKLVQRNNNQYKPIWINKNDLFWDGTDQLSEFYLLGPNGDKYDCRHLITHLPKLNEPTLWTKYSDAQWTLEKGRHTSQEEGFILYPADYCHQYSGEVRELRINEKRLNWIAFVDAIVLSGATTQHRFKAGSKKIEWYIEDRKPNWMQRANFPVVRGKPRVIVFDVKGNLIPNPIIKWRQVNGSYWCDWKTPITQGLIEIQIQACDIIEYDSFFNIGPLELQRESSSLHQAEVQLLNNSFLFQVHESSLVEVEKVRKDRFLLKLKQSTCIPNAIQASLKAGQQAKSLRFEILPPFKGIEIIDNEQRILPNGTNFNLSSLKGYRLLSNVPGLVVNLYNSKRPWIISSEALTESVLSLRTYEDKINQLYTLSDSMDGDAEIVLEFCEQTGHSQTKQREYKVRRYDQKIEWQVDEQKELIIKTSPVAPDLFAVPLDCSDEELNVFDLENMEGNYHFRSMPALQTFIIFGSKDTDVCIQPALLSLDPENAFVASKERVQRIINLRNALLNGTPNDDVWQRFLFYHKVCFTNDLPYSTFDVLRTIGFSSALAAKAFVFLLCYNDAASFSEESQKKMEQDLGLCFHWVNRNHWGDAMNWIGCFENKELMDVVSPGLKGYFNTLSPNNHFAQISNYVIQYSIPKINGGYHLNGRVQQLRASLGPKVLSELPEKCPNVPESYKDIIPVNEDNAKVKILLQSPLAVALSISGKSESLWEKESENIRRNVKYSYQLNPEWYGEAVCYCLTKI